MSIPPKLTMQPEATVASRRVEFVQPMDSCGPDDGDEGDDDCRLTVETCDAGGGVYLVIKTRRWSVDPEHLEAFVSMLRGVAAGVDGWSGKEEDQR